MSAPDHLDDIREKLVDFHKGNLSARESVLVESALKKNPQLRKEYESLKIYFERLGKITKPDVPSDFLASVKQKIQSRREKQKSQKVYWFGGMASVLALSLVAVIFLMPGIPGLKFSEKNVAESNPSQAKVPSPTGLALKLKDGESTRLDKSGGIKNEEQKKGGLTTKPAAGKDSTRTGQDFFAASKPSAPAEALTDTKVVYLALQDAVSVNERRMESTLSQTSSASGKSMKRSDSGGAPASKAKASESDALQDPVTGEKPLPKILSRVEFEKIVRSHGGLIQAKPTGGMTSKILEVEVPRSAKEKFLQQIAGITREKSVFSGEAKKESETSSRDESSVSQPDGLYEIRLIFK